jgi:hypothetical protein
MPKLNGTLDQITCCNMAAIFIVTINTRLEAIPIITAGIDNNSIVLARGCSMKHFLLKVVKHDFALPLRGVDANGAETINGRLCLTIRRALTIILHRLQPKCDIGR